MGRLRNASLLGTCLLSVFCNGCALADPKADRLQSLIRGPNECVVGGDANLAEPVCIAETAMVTSSPERYCGKRILLYGYLNPKNYRLFASRDAASHGLHFFSILIDGDEVRTALDKYQKTNDGIIFAVVSARYNCSNEIERHAALSIGRLVEVQEIGRVIGFDESIGIYDQNFN